MNSCYNRSVSALFANPDFLAGVIFTVVVLLFVVSGLLAIVYIGTRLAFRHEAKNLGMVDDHDDRHP